MTAYEDLMQFQRETEALGQIAGRLGQADCVLFEIRLRQIRPLDRVPIQFLCRGNNNQHIRIPFDFDARDSRSEAAPKPRAGFDKPQCEGL